MSLTLLNINFRRAKGYKPTTFVRPWVGTRDASGKIVTAYIEVLATYVMWRIDLDDDDLWSIADFERGNIALWLNCKDRSYAFEIGVYGWEDFHAAWGDVDIPWSSEESKLAWENAHPPSQFGRRVPLDDIP